MSLSPKPVLVTACLALACGGGGAALLSASAGASPVTSPAAATAPTGTGTVSLTGPKGKTHTTTVPVTCKVADGRYVVRAGKSGARRGTDLRLRVGHYTGPGNYTGTVLVAHHRVGSSRSQRYSEVPVTLTAAGGSFTYSKTLTGKRHPALKGKTISAAASWTCSA